MRARCLEHSVIGCVPCARDRVEVLRAPDADLRARVALMRELGVLQWDGIVLGPVPPPRREALSAAEREARQAARAEAERDLDYAATGVRPA